MSTKMSSGRVIQIKFDTPTHFQGRNGYFKCTGLEITTHSDDAEFVISPITSRGRTGNCAIEIPKSKIDELKNALDIQKEHFL